MEENTETIKTVSPIETALAKENVTNQVIQKLKESYLGLTINGLEDKKGFKAVEDARKECKSIRTLAVRICKKGREDAIQTQKDWIAKEKEVVAEIEVVEGYLESESNKIKELEKKILFEAAQKEKLHARKEKLSLIGFEVEDAELLKIDDNQYDALYNDFYKKHLEEQAEKLRLENERIAAQKAEEERIKREEEQRIDNLHKERTKLAMPYYQFWSEFEITLHFGTQSDGDFNNFMARIEKAKATYDLENEKLRKAKEEAEENLRLIEETNKRIEKERQEMLDKRGIELQPYIVFIRDYNALINSNEDNYQHQFKEIKKGAQDHWEFERKEQLRKQQEEEKKEAQLKAEREAKLKLEAELKAKADLEAKAKAEAEQKEKERLAAEKKAAKAPIKEQLIIWMNSCELMPTPSIKNEEAQAKVSEILLKYASFKKWANEQIESL